MYYVNPNIKNLKRIFPKENRQNYLRLDMNENPEGLPETFIKNVLNQIDGTFLSTYPYYDQLINKISNHIFIDKEQIVLTNGSDMAIKYVFDVFGKEGGELVTVSPTFEMYNVYSKMYGLKQIKIDYNSDFSIDTEKIIDSININTNIVTLLNPNSPIGNTYSNETVEKIIEKAEECGAIVIIDEAYYYFYDKTYIDMVNKYKNVIVIRTFSKLCSIANCRIGFLVSNNTIVRYIKNAKLTFEVNGIGVKFVEAILDTPNLINELVEIERDGRNYLISELERNGYEYYSDNGNYVFIKTKNSPIEIYEKLKEKRVLVKVYSYEIFKNYIRVTTGSKKIMKQFVLNLLQLDN